DDGSGDYHLKSGSAAILGGTTSGAGSPGCDSSCAPANDFTGSARTAPVDIGAYLYIAGSPPPPVPSPASGTVSPIQLSSVPVTRPSSPWRNHVFLSGEICIGDSGDFDDG